MNLSACWTGLEEEEEELTIVGVEKTTILHLSVKPFHANDPSLAFRQAKRTAWFEQSGNSFYLPEIHKFDFYISEILRSPSLSQSTLTSGCRSFSPESRSFHRSHSCRSSPASLRGDCWPSLFEIMKILWDFWTRKITIKWLGSPMTSSQTPCEETGQLTESVCQEEEQGSRLHLRWWRTHC